MSENGLALLNVRRNIQIKPERAVDIYATKHPRRVWLL